MTKQEALRVLSQSIGFLQAQDKHKVAAALMDVLITLGEEADRPTDEQIRADVDQIKSDVARMKNAWNLRDKHQS